MEKMRGSPRMLEQEVVEFLGWKKSERRSPASPIGDRNGHRKPRQLVLMTGGRAATSTAWRLPTLRAFPS